MALDRLTVLMTVDYTHILSFHPQSGGYMASIP